MNYLIVADDMGDNSPIGVMIIESPDIQVTLREVFANEPNCDAIRYGLIYTPELPNGVMVNWDRLDIVMREDFE